MLSIVIVNWNGWVDTISCIQSLLNSVDEFARIIVVDNKSTDNSVQKFESWAAGTLNICSGNTPLGNMIIDGVEKTRLVRFGRYVEPTNSFEGFDESMPASVESDFIVYFVESGRNGGFGFGCNVGMRLADKLGSSAYWLLNSDCAVSRDALAKIRNAILLQPMVIFGTVVRFYDQPETIQAVGGGTLSRWTGHNKMCVDGPLTQSLDFIYGASMAFSRQLRVAVGDFDERIFMYFEEIDFCLRATAVGYSCAVVDAQIYHKHGGSQGGVSSAAAWMNVLVNKYYVLKKHFGWGTWVMFFWTSLILRCLFPIGGKNALVGARQALKILLKTRLSR